jgi:glycosyltransferase involved in cell wall biosynthesis
VAFRGYVADPTSGYGAAAVLALASAWEGLPAVAVEALAAGCPVVATDCSPALSRLVAASGVGGVAPSEPEAFAAALAAVLDAPPTAVSTAALAPYVTHAAVAAHLRALPVRRRSVDLPTGVLAAAR